MSLQSASDFDGEAKQFPSDRPCYAILEYLPLVTSVHCSNSYYKENALRRTGLRRKTRIVEFEPRGKETATRGRQRRIHCYSVNLGKQRSYINRADLSIVQCPVNTEEPFVCGAIEPTRGKVGPTVPLYRSLMRNLYSNLRVLPSSPLRLMLNASGNISGATRHIHHGEFEAGQRFSNARLTGRVTLTHFQIPEENYGKRLHLFSATSAEFRRYVLEFRLGCCV